MRGDYATVATVSRANWPLIIGSINRWINGGLSQLMHNCGIILQRSLSGLTDS